MLTTEPSCHPTRLTHAWLVCSSLYTMLHSAASSRFLTKPGPLCSPESEIIWPCPGPSPGDSRALVISQTDPLPLPTPSVSVCISLSLKNKTFKLSSFSHLTLANIAATQPLRHGFILSQNHRAKGQTLYIPQGASALGLN